MKVVHDQIYAAVRLALRFPTPLTPDEIRLEVEMAITAELLRQEERKLENLTASRELRRANKK